MGSISLRCKCISLKRKLNECEIMVDNLEQFIKECEGYDRIIYNDLGTYYKSIEHKFLFSKLNRARANFNKVQTKNCKLQSKQINDIDDIETAIDRFGFASLMHSANIAYEHACDLKAKIDLEGKKMRYPDEVTQKEYFHSVLGFVSEIEDSLRYCLKTSKEVLEKTKDDNRQKYCEKCNDEGRDA